MERIFLKLIKFGFLVKKLTTCAPEELKDFFEKNQIPNHNYSLRSATNLYLKADKIVVKSGDLTFKNFFAKLLNNDSVLNST